MVLTWVMTVSIICLNTAVIVKILQYKKMSRLYTFLLHLAIADLVTGLIDCLPNSIERTMGYDRTIMMWMAGDAMCKIQRTIAQCSAMTSNYILACMSADRAMVVYKPMHSVNRGTTIQKRAILGCWIFTLCLSSILTPFFKVTYDGTLCETVFSSDRRMNLYYFEVMLIVMFICMVAIPFIVIVITYVILIVCIYRRGISPSNSLKQPDALITTRVFNNAIPRSKIRTIKLTIGIVVCFLISWVPFFVIMFLTLYSGFHHPVVMIMVTCYYLNSIANPILFFIYHRRRTRSFPRSFYSSETTPGKPNPYDNGRYTPNTTKPITPNGNGCVRNSSKERTMIPLVENGGVCGGNGDCGINSFGVKSS